MIRAPCNPRPNRADGHSTTEQSGEKGNKTHIAVDTLGNLLALVVTPADEQDRAQVGELAEAVQQVTGEAVEIAFVDMGYTGETAAEEARAYGIRLEVVKLSEAKKGFVLLPRRWVVERSFGWAARFPSFGARLRAIAGNARRTALLGVRCADAQTVCRDDRS